MIRLTKAVEIERPVDEVFAFVANLENIPRWNGDVVKTKKMSAGPIEAGTTFRQYRDGLSGAGEAVAITAHSPHERLEVRARLADSPAQLTYEFDEVDGGTRLINEIEVDPKGAMRLITPVVESRVGHSVAENLAELKRVLEAA